MILDTLTRFLIIYFIHSTLLFALAECVSRFVPSKPKLRLWSWQAAAWAGLGSLALVVGQDLFGAAFPDLRVWRLPAMEVTSLAELGSPPAQVLAARWPQNVLGILFVIWAVGALYGVIRWFGALATLKRMLANRQPVQNEVHRTLGQEVAERVGFDSPVVLSVSEALVSPVAIGRREVCLPPSCLEAFDKQVLLAVLGHEICHLKRLDPFSRPAWRLVAAIFWLQPLWRRFLRSREQAIEEICDRSGAKVQDNARVMAQALVDMASRAKMPVPNPATALFGTPQELSRRVQALLDFEDSSPSRKEKTMIKVIPSIIILSALALPSIAPVAAPASVPAAEPMKSADKANNPELGVWVRQAVNSMIKGVRVCYNRGLVKDPKLSGKVEVRFKIGADGKALWSRLERSSLPDAGVNDCLVGSMEKLDLGRSLPGGAAEVVYPFVLEPG